MIPPWSHDTKAFRSDKRMTVRMKNPTCQLSVLIFTNAVTIVKKVMQRTNPNMFRTSCPILKKKKSTEIKETCYFKKQPTRKPIFGIRFNKWSMIIFPFRWYLANAVWCRQFPNLTSVGCLQFNSKPIVLKPFNMVPSILRHVSSKKLRITEAITLLCKGRNKNILENYSSLSIFYILFQNF